jgi:endonuclease/exonuclease/phosphatase family metal-dependent hydrolase
VLASHLPALAYCAVAVVGLAASLFGRWVPGLLAAGAALYLAAVPLGGWTRPSRPPAEGAAYRVLTWNVEQWLGGGVRLAHAIAALEPDVFCLQEARNYDRREDLEWPAFEAELPGYRLIRDGEMAIGTRWPVIEERRTPLHDELWKRPLLEVELQAPNGARLRVLDTHLAYTSYHGKLPGSLVPAALARRAQAERIIAYLGTSAEPTILCGDLNATPNTAALRVLRRRFDDAWRLRGLGFGLTTSAREPLRRIDYLLVSDVEVGDVRVLTGELSDHRAVTATFALAPAGARAPRGALVE